MKPIIYSILFMLLPGIILAQEDTVYTTSSGELIFSFASVDYAGNEDGAIMRFSPVVNIQNWLNYDKSEKFGFFTGLSVRNVASSTMWMKQPEKNIERITLVYWLELNRKPVR